MKIERWQVENFMLGHSAGLINEIGYPWPYQTLYFLQSSGNGGFALSEIYAAKIG